LESEGSLIKPSLRCLDPKGFYGRSAAILPSLVPEDGRLPRCARNDGVAWLSQRFLNAFIVFGLDLDRPVNYSLPMTPVHGTKQRLLDTARELFYARSYEDVGVQEICREAGVKKGSFYHFFHSKRDLTVAMLDESWEKFRATLQKEVFVRDIPPLQRIQRLLDMQYRLHTEAKAKTGHVSGCPFGNLAGEMSTQDEVIRERVKRIFRDLEVPIRDALEEAVTAGDLPDLNSRATASAMVAYLEGLSLMAKTHNDPDIVKQLGPAILKLMVAPGEG